MTRPQSILVIDDDADLGEFLADAFTDMGLHCTITQDADSFLDNLSADTTLILLDLIMPGLDGVELLRVLAARQCKARIVLMSNEGKRAIETTEELAKTLGLAVVGHLEKPFQLETLQAVLTDFTQSAQTQASSERPAFVINDKDLGQAIARGEFLLHYQPQIHIPSMCVSGIEALVRWHHPTQGLIFPDSFIFRLEQLGLIDELTWDVLSRGFTDLPTFAADNQTLPTLSINVAAQSLRNIRFPEKLVALANEFSIPLDKVILEITESGLIQELSSTLDDLAQLRSKHVQLSIDDFGTGYSIMQQLRLIPATELKIDKFFVQNIFTKDSARMLVLKTIEIGHELGMQVVAEGVETTEQLAFLRDHECDVAQGYLFSRPLPAQQLLTWLRDYGNDPSRL